MTHAISSEGLALIQDAEGFRSDPAQLPDGAWLVGYGHVRAGDAGAAVSKEEAAALLSADLADIERAVNEAVNVELTQSQFDALVSFAMSIGVESFAQSQVLRRVNNGEHIAAACALDAWRKAEVEGQFEVVDALVCRRAAEKALYLRGVAAQAAPSVFVRAYLDHAASVLGAPVAFTAPPAVETLRPRAVRPDAAVRLVEILKSEPATEALLLTRVVPAEEDVEAGEIVTAHARPAARPAFDFEPPVARDRRIAKLRDSEESESLLDRLSDRFEPSQAFETVGLIALMLFGVGLLLIAGSLVFGPVEDMMQYVIAAGLMLPGVASVAVGGWAFSRGADAPANA